MRFAATKLVEGDELVTEALHLDRNELDAIEHIIAQMEGEAGTDRPSALADMRFGFIGDVCGRCVVKPHESREHVRSVKIDRILTGRYTAIPAFLVIMGLVFWLTFGVIGAALQGLMEDGIAAIIASADAGLKAFGTNDVVRSLAVDGVLTGVGSVLTFLPIIVVLFLFLSILEDSGYMARVAFVMDKVLRRFGLSGRSFVPMLVGFGCTVPAIMSTRTLPSEHDRKMTVMLTPFMSCSAKLPVYGLLCGAFFPQATVPAMVSLYLIGIAIGCIAALVLNRTAFKGDPVPFIMELPNYRLPSVKTTVMLAWDKAKDFITKPLPLSLPLPWSSGSFRRSTFALMWSPISRKACLRVSAASSRRRWRRLGLAIGEHPRRSSPALSPRRVSSRPSRCFWARPRPRHCRPCFRRSPPTCSWSLRCCTRPAWRPSVPSRASWVRAMPLPCSRFR